MCIINPSAVCENEKRVYFNDYNWFETLAVANNTFPLNPNTLEITSITVVPFVSNLPVTIFHFWGNYTEHTHQKSPL